MKQSIWTPEQYLAAHQTSLKATQAKTALEAQELVKLKGDNEVLRFENAKLRGQTTRES